MSNRNNGKVQNQNEVINGKFEEVKQPQETNTETTSESQPEVPVNDAPEVKPDFVDKWYTNYCERRQKKAEKKANKKPMNPKLKTALKVGGLILGCGLLMSAGKAFLGGGSSGEDYCYEEDETPEITDGTDDGSSSSSDEDCSSSEE